MAYEHNDIATKSRLRAALEETNMGFEHNDIVTVDAMNKAIAEGGGGGIVNEIFPFAANMKLTLSGQGGLTYTFTDLTGTGTYFATEDDGTYQVEDGEINLWSDGEYNVVVLSNYPVEEEGGGYFEFDDSAWTVTASGDAEVSGGAVTITGDCELTAVHN